MIRVIVIDDEHDVSEVLCEFLKIKEINVVGRGKNGKDAITLYQKLHPDIVLMDLVMPEYDGFYGIEEIRKFDPKSKIMIISASLTHSYVQKLLKMNVNSISLKPYDLNNVIEVIHKVNQGIKIKKIPAAFAKNS
ncbi:MAG TPA: response regulator transcription factor [Nitrosopumilaceae archaeon]|nr:response regulator transcription factor [Nitrosopumilaceae archaeon]